MTHARGSLPETIGGRYRIESRIGSGGMGVVYKARDTRLNRLVAIKAIHDHRTQDGGRRLRDEAMAAASLDHPYICQVYELVEDTGEFYLVMEFVDGETLASRLRRGPLPLPRALEVGSEIAEGLANAHGRGLVHRDIKPSNVMVTPHGHIKLLDFGLAQPDVITPPADRTRTSPSGASDYAGTPQYMAPEQALGSPVTARADLFSLGVILFESITGRLPFAGASGYDYVRHLLSDDPRPMERLAPDAPMDLARLVHRCLEKTPANRPESADVVLAELRRLSASLTATGPTLPTAREARGRSRSYRVAAAAVALSTLVVLWALWPAPTPIEVLDRSRQFVTWGTLEFDSRVAPGGDWVSFFSMDGDRTRLFVQPVGGGDAIPVALADGRPDSHTWSPDGTEIAVLISHDDSAALHIVPPFGGPARRRIPVPSQPVHVALVRWVGRSVYLKASRTVSRLDLDAESIVDVSRDWPFAGSLGDLDVSPDGTRIVYALSMEGRQDLWTAPLSGSRPERLTDDEFFERRPVFRGDGRTVVYQSNRGGPVGLWELDIASGRGRPLTSGAGLDAPGGSSLDGQLLSFTREALEAKLWLWNGGTGRQLDTATESDFSPSLSADRRTLVFQRNQPSPEAGHSLIDSSLYVARFDADGRVEGTRALTDGFAPQLSPDGTWLAYLVRGPSPQALGLRLRHLRTDEQIVVSDAAPLPTVAASPPLDWVDQIMAWSPTGHALYFVERTGAESIRQFDLADRRAITLVTTTGDGRIPDLVAAADGSRLAFRLREAGRDRIRTVDLGTGTTIDLDTFDGPGTVRLRGWLPDGSAVVLVRPIASHADRSSDIEVLGISLDGGRRLIGTVPRGFVATARFDPPSSALFVTRSEKGVHNVWALDVGTGDLSVITDNALEGVTFSGIGAIGPRRVLMVRDVHRQDIWLSERDAPR